MCKLDVEIPKIVGNKGNPAEEILSDAQKEKPLIPNKTVENQGFSANFYYGSKPVKTG